jgi:hypothetical protein
MKRVKEDPEISLKAFLFTAILEIRKIWFFSTKFLTRKDVGAHGYDLHVVMNIFMLEWSLKTRNLDTTV